MPVIDRVAPEDALQRVQDALGDLGSDVHLNHDHVDLTCTPDDFPAVAERLRDAEGLRCRFFTFLSGVDWSVFGDEEGEGEETDKRRGFEVLLHVYSPDHVIHVNVHVPLGADATCRSVSSVYSGALWHERETHEMFGIVFEGHPKLVGLYLPEDFEGHPLRKSFKLPSRVVKPWPGAKDPGEASAGGRG